MGRTRTYSKADLTFACSQVKRNILNQFKNGRMTKLNKKFVFDKIASQPRIGLETSRTLQDKDFEFHDYLEEWYKGLIVEVETVLNLPEDHPSTPPSPVSLATENYELREKIKQQQLFIRGLQTRLENVSKELRKFYEREVPRWGKIDAAISEVALAAYDGSEDKKT